jgi:hypothetical protein
MSSGDSNFDPRASALPAAFTGCPEETLLAWIEGELSPSEVSTLAERYPRAVPLVASLRRDRATLAAASSARAPGDLADRVLAAVEREALLGLSQGEPLSDSLPISQVPKRKTPRQLWFQQAAPRLALAAGLVLVVSAGAIFALRGAKPTNTVGPLALNDAPEVPAPIAARTAATLESSGDPAPPAATLADTARSKVAAADSAIDTGTLAPQRAAELAGEGRLVLRVRDVPTSAVARLASIRAKVSPTWQVQGDLAQPTLAMLTPAAPMPVAAPEFEPPAFASGLASGERDLVSINPMLLSAPPIDLGPVGPRHAGSVVDVRADAASIEAAREQLSKLLGCVVEFEESDQPIVLDPQAATPEAVLWWTQPPQSWAKRLRVPLVVELR